MQQAEKGIRANYSELHAGISIIKTSLSSIDILPNIAAGLQVRFRYASKIVGLMNDNVMDILQMIEPLVVVRHFSKSKDRYQLISGLRTYQLIYQERGMEESCIAMLINKTKSIQENGINIFDSYVKPVINLPGSLDVEYIGAHLYSNQEIRKAVAEFLTIQTQDDVAKAFGVNRSTLRDWKKKVVSEPSLESPING